MPDCLDTLRKLKENIAKVIVGKEQTVELLLVCLAAGGHALIEDVPGTGKTVLAKSLCASASLTFSRIQFTPDLLPSDVTGLNYFDQSKSRFVFRPGPVFSHILLADEINRATPRTQSALLECMAEHQVTVDGQTRTLEDPFFVIATQNPVETLGTFPLPEAQLDRFLMQISMGEMSEEEELLMIDRFISHEPLQELAPCCGIDEILTLRRKCRKVYVHPDRMQRCLRAPGSPALYHSAHPVYTGSAWFRKQRFCKTGFHKVLFCKSRFSWERTCSCIFREDSADAGGCEPQGNTCPCPCFSGLCLAPGQGLCDSGRHSDLCCSGTGASLPVFRNLIRKGERGADPVCINADGGSDRELEARMNAACCTD